MALQAYTHIDNINAYFTSVATATKLNLVSNTSLPTAVGGELLVADFTKHITDITLTAGIGNGDYTRTSDTVLTISGHTGVTITATGSITGVILHDGTNVKRVVPTAVFPVTINDINDIGSFTITRSGA